MPIKINSSGGGSVTLDVPATATNTTLNLPAASLTLVGTGSITTSGLTQNTSRLLGRTTASAGAVEEISVGTGLTLSAGTISASGGGQLQEQLFTSSGTWTVPTGVTRVNVIVIGGGGGGAGATAGLPFGGRHGGVGGLASGNYSVTPGSSITVTVGVGGAANVSSSGSAGGTSSFGSLISATGGGGGVINSANGAAGAGSSGTVRNNSILYGASINDATDNGTIANAIPFGIAPFTGNARRGAAAGLTAALTWTVGSNLSPGAAGSRETDSCFGTPNDCTGGVSGIVYITWVG